MIQKRYWLKGGLILSGLYIFLSAASFLLNEVFELDVTGMFFILLQAPLYFFYGFLGGRGGGFFNGLEAFALPSIIGYTFLVVIYFIVGAILGWLYGKIKSRKSSHV